MPVNMDPSKRRRKPQASQQESDDPSANAEKNSAGVKKFGEETEADRQKALADAEWKNLWDQTEVIDMDKW